MAAGVVDVEGSPPVRYRPDPLLELMGWHAEPLLLRRLNFYLVEAIVECASLGVALYLSQRHLHPPGLFVRLLVLPFAIVSVKLCWIACLVGAYWSVQGVAVSAALKRIGRFHMRSFWSCSAAMLTCFSCLLMMWHTIMFLLMMGYIYSPAESFVVKVIFVQSAFFVVVNWAFWRDFVKNYKDEDNLELERKCRLREMHNLYKSNAISVCTFGTTGTTAAGTSQACEGAAKRETCVICIQDFQPSDDVAILPCGHVFHPTCVNLWIMENWSCPLRCSLNEAPSVQCKKADVLGAAEEGRGHEATASTQN